MPVAEFAKYPNVKVVNINATIPIVNVTPQLYGYREGIKMTLSDILKCLMRRAIIHEVMPDGSTIRLTLKNFRDDNRALLKAEKEKKTEEQPKVEETKVASQELSQKQDEQPAIFVTGMSLEGDVPAVEDQPAVLTTSASTSDEEVVIEAKQSEPVKVEEATATVTTTKSTSKKSSKKKKK